MSTKYCRLNTPGYKEDIDQGWLIQGHRSQTNGSRRETPQRRVRGVGQDRAAVHVLGDDVPIGIGIVKDSTCSFKKR